MTAKQCLAEDMECNKVIKVIIWCNVQSGVVFSPHMDPNSVAMGGDAAVTIWIIRGSALC